MKVGLMAPWRGCAAAAAIFLVPCAQLSVAASAVGPAARIEVDAREAPRGIMTAHLVLPVAAGPLTLVYPKWLPGRHSPAGPVTSLGGIRFTAAGQPLPWRRDPVDLYAFHLQIPAGGFAPHP